MVNLLEADDYLLVVIITVFLTINFNLEVGLIYSLIAIVDWLAYYIAFDKNAFKIVPIENNKKDRLINLVWGMGAYVVFIFTAGFLTARFTGVSTVSTFENISSLVAATFSATPILFGSTNLKLMVWGVLIPIIETRFFFRTLLQYGIRSGNLKMPQSALSLQAFGIAAFFGAIFTVYHAVAKGITNNASLAVTFMFGVVSILLVIHFKELIQALFLHIITNTIATMQQQGIGFFAPGATGISQGGIVILGAVILVSWFLMFQQIPFIQGVKANG